MKIFNLVVLAVLFSLTSCVSRKKTVYFQGDQNASIADVNYEPKIQNDDLLSIRVLSSQSELSASFNVTSSTNLDGYLVDQYGDIEFPVLGKLHVAGYSKTELKQFFKDKLALYLTDPIIDVKILNFKVSIIGEVNTPGTFKFTTDRVTILDLLAVCGDLTPFGKRDNVLLVRDYQGKKIFNRIDITKSDLVNSPFYYLDQNDVVYVEPRKAKIDSAGIIGTNVVTIISIFTGLLTTYLILTRL